MTNIKGSHAMRRKRSVGQRFLSGLLQIGLVFATVGQEAIAEDGTMLQIEKIEAVAYGAFVNGHFSRLNSMVEDFRSSKGRLPDGRWKLTFVTSGLTRGVVPRDVAAWEARLAIFDKWLSTTPDDPVPHLAKAIALVSYAWDARGGGYANSVKESDWPIFRKRIADARAVLEKAPKISKNNPLWYDTMQTIALAQSWPMENYGKLFQEGVDKEPTYYFLYFNAASYFLPRWHGNPSDLAKFVDYAVEKSSRQEGQTLYARIYWSLLWALRDNTFAPAYAQWPRMRQGFSDIVKSYPDNWNLNAFVYYACMAKDSATVRQIAPRLKTIEKDLWEDPNAYKTCLETALKGSGKTQ